MTPWASASARWRSSRFAQSRRRRPGDRDVAVEGDADHRTGRLEGCHRGRVVREDQAASRTRPAGRAREGCLGDLAVDAVAQQLEDGLGFGHAPDRSESQSEAPAATPPARSSTDVIASVTGSNEASPSATSTGLCAPHQAVAPGARRRVELVDPLRIVDPGGQGGERQTAHRLGHAHDVRARWVVDTVPRE